MYCCCCCRPCRPRPFPPLPPVPPMPRPFPPLPPNPCFQKDFAQFVNSRRQRVDTREAVAVEFPETVVDNGRCIRKCDRSNAIYLAPGKYNVNYFVNIRNQQHLLNQQDVFTARLYLAGQALDYTKSRTSLCDSHDSAIAFLSKSNIIEVRETSLLQLFVNLNRLDNIQCAPDYRLSNASIVIERIC